MQRETHPFSLNVPAKLKEPSTRLWEAISLCENTRRAAEMKLSYIFPRDLKKLWAASEASTGDYFALLHTFAAASSQPVQWNGQITSSYHCAGWEWVEEQTNLWLHFVAEQIVFDHTPEIDPDHPDFQSEVVKTVESLEPADIDDHYQLAMENYESVAVLSSADMKVLRAGMMQEYSRVALYRAPVQSDDREEDFIENFRHVSPTAFDVLTVIKQHGKRMTNPEITKFMTDRDGTDRGEAVTKALQELKAAKAVINKSNTKPRGYGLSYWAD